MTPLLPLQLGIWNGRPSPLPSAADAMYSHTDSATNNRQKGITFLLSYRHSRIFRYSLSRQDPFFFRLIRFGSRGYEEGDHEQQQQQQQPAQRRRRIRLASWVGVGS